VDHPGRPCCEVFWIIQSTFPPTEWPDKQPKKGWTSGGHSSSLGQSGVQQVMGMPLLIRIDGGKHFGIVHYQRTYLL
jgi:hypothetical protein